MRQRGPSAGPTPGEAANPPAAGNPSAGEPQGPPPANPLPGDPASPPAGVSRLPDAAGNRRSAGRLPYGTDVRPAGPSPFLDGTEDRPAVAGPLLKGADTRWASASHPLPSGTRPDPLPEKTPSRPVSADPAPDRSNAGPRPSWPHRRSAAADEGERAAAGVPHSRTPLDPVRPSAAGRTQSGVPPRPAKVTGMTRQRRRPQSAPPSRLRSAKTSDSRASRKATPPHHGEWVTPQPRSRRSSGRPTPRPASPPPAGGGRTEGLAPRTPAPRKLAPRTPEPRYAGASGNGLRPVPATRDPQIPHEQSPHRVTRPVTGRPSGGRRSTAASTCPPAPDANHPIR